MALKYLIPKRVFINGEKKILSIRIPGDLRVALESIAKDYGRDLTDLIITVLDQFAQGCIKDVNKPKK